MLWLIRLIDEIGCDMDIIDNVLYISAPIKVTDLVKVKNKMQELGKNYEIRVQ